MKKRMRMIMAMVAVLLLLLTSGTVLAASSGKCGINITWTLDDNGNLVLTGSGPMDDYLYSRGPWKDCENLIKTVSIEDGITSIGNYTFQECSGLTSVVIPNSVTSIGVYAFLKCSGMASLVIGNSVTSIGRYAFCGCSSLTRVVMGNSVGGVGELAFYGCSNLTEVFITDLAAWCMIEFNGYVSNPLYFAHHLFLNGIEVKNLVIPNSVTSIGNFAFHGCSELTSVEIPNSVKNIGESAFNGCRGLTRITVGGLNPTYDSRDNCNAIIETSTGKIILACKNTNIPNGVIGIDRDDFSGISGLKSVTIPASVASIEGGAFSCCPDLMSIYVDGNNPTYDSRDNCNAIIEKNSNTLISSCVGTKIPSSVTSIGDNAFYGCYGLTSVEIPNSVTSIGDNAFYGCYGLTSVAIPNLVTSIGDNAFYNCSGLTRVDITDLAAWSMIEYVKPYGWMSPSSNPLSWAQHLYLNGEEVKGDLVIPNTVTRIGRGAYMGWNGLTSVSIPNSVTSIGYSAFMYCDNLTSLTIGNSVTSIGMRAFDDCSGLERIEAWAKVPPVCENDVFFGVYTNKCELVVPEGCVDAYRNANQWKNFLKISAGVDDVVADKADVKVTVAGGEIAVTGEDAEGAVVEVYGIGGELVYKGKSHSIAVPRRGIYIVSIAGKVQKVAVQ